MSKSFYSAHIFVCTNSRPPGHKRGCCQEKGAESLRNYMKARAKELGLSGPGGVRVNMAGCLDRCELGPAMVVYPEAVWYSPKTNADIDEILESHIQGGRPVARLMMKEGE